MTPATPQAPALDQDKLDQLAIDSESGRTRRLSGWQGWLAAGICATMSLYALYWTQFAVNTSIYRAAFLGLVLAAAFLIFPLFPKGEGKHVRIVDWLLIALAFASVYYFCTHLEATKTRATADGFGSIASGRIVSVARRGTM